MKRSVLDLRRDASSILERVELDGIHLVSSNYTAVPRRGEFEIVTAFSVDTKTELNDDVLRTWVRHYAWALVDTPDLELPDDPDDVPAETIEAHLAWQAGSEWVAEYVPSDERSLEDLDLSACAAFAIILGPPTVHPYAREHFQALVSKGPYPAFTLPHYMPLSGLPDDEQIEIQGA